MSNGFPTNPPGSLWKEFKSGLMFTSLIMLILLPPLYLMGHDVWVIGGLFSLFAIPSGRRGSEWRLWRAVIVDGGLTVAVLAVFLATGGEAPDPLWAGLCLIALGLFMFRSLYLLHKGYKEAAASKEPS